MICDKLLYRREKRLNFAEHTRYAEYGNFIGLDPVHKAPALLNDTVYGLPELHDITSDQSIVGNPGCFAVSCIVGLAPAVKEGLLTPNSIICDCKTGHCF